MCATFADELVCMFLTVLMQVLRVFLDCVVLRNQWSGCECKL